MFCLVLQVSSLLAAKRQKIVMQADGGSSGVSADAFQRTMQLVNVLAHSQLLFCHTFSHICPHLLALTCICLSHLLHPSLPRHSDAGKRSPGRRRRRGRRGGRDDSPQNARKERRTLDVDRRAGAEISNYRERQKTANHMTPLFFDLIFFCLCLRVRCLGPRNFFANARVRICQGLKGPLPEGSGFDKEGLPLPLDWNSYATQSGDIYYHRPSTGET